MTAPRPLLLKSLFALLLFWMSLLTPVLANTADWNGDWDARWRNGGARVTLVQDGERVTGTYTLYGGSIEGVARGRELRATWRQGDESGELIAVQAPDGKSFTARLGNGEWWTGMRATDDQRSMAATIDQSSPSLTLYYFLAIMNAVGPGTMELQSEASHLIDWTAGKGDITLSQIDYTRLLFDVLDHMTLRIPALQRSTEGQRYSTLLMQAGSNISIDIQFNKHGESWFIEPPALALLQDLLSQLTAYRLKNDVRHINGFQSPRDTIKTLMTRFNESDPASIKRVIQALDLSDLSELAKKYEAPRLAGYLKRAIDRIGTQIWQEIPDDQDSLQPFVYFEHPVGQIAISPVDTEHGTVWKFTPDTLKKIRSLYAAIDEMPAATVTIGQQQTKSAYFILRDFVADGHHFLVRMLGPMEVWQWLALALALIVAYVMGRVVSVWVGVPLLRRYEKNLSEHPYYQKSLVWSLRLFFTGATLRMIDEPIGLPDMVEVFVLTVSWSVMTISVAILILIIINLMTERAGSIRAMAGHNITLVSLSAGIARVLVVVAAVIMIANTLKIPYQGVLAGLGIGGLAVALAAQSTLQNFISGITLYFDKPIAIGDFCRFGDREGTVEFIGMRSTRIRTLDRTLVTIPNSEFSNMQIENYAKRDRMFLNTTLQLRYETTPDQLRFVLAKIRELLIAHPKVAADPLRVRFVGFGNHSLDVDLFAYVLTNSKPEFLAIREDIFLQIMALVKEAGTQFAFPSMVYYQAQDTPNDPQKTATAQQTVERWREHSKLPFPDHAWQDKAELSDTLEYPPAGSAVAQEFEEKNFTPKT